MHMKLMGLSGRAHHDQGLTIRPDRQKALAVDQAQDIALRVQAIAAVLWIEIRRPKVQHDPFATESPQS
jgi:hypothetical protein